MYIHKKTSYLNTSPPLANPPLAYPAQTIYLCVHKFAQIVKNESESEAENQAKGLREGKEAESGREWSVHGKSKIGLGRVSMSIISLFHGSRYYYI